MNFYNQFVPGKDTRYCGEYVCLSVRSNNSKTTQNFCVHVGSVFLWRRCDTLCTSGFVDDVICLDLMALWCVVFNLKWQYNATSMTTEISTKFCSVIIISKY